MSAVCTPHTSPKGFCQNARWMFLKGAAAACLFLGTVTASVAACKGTFPNPVTDVCWSCLFPMKVAGVRVSSSGVTDPETDAPAVCTCQRGPAVVPGFNMSFWEPLRTVEIVREPYCLVSLGGVSMDPGINAPRHGQSSRRSASAASSFTGAKGGDAVDNIASGTAFYQAHWYHTPWLFVLEAVVDTSCLENAAWDLAYLTELDPLWGDALASFVLAPESAIFANPVAVGACALDCTAAGLAAPRPELFWCNGCQGSLYPLSGWIASKTSHLQAWHLIAARMSVKLAREGLLWAAYGKKGQCGPYFEPIPRKDVWRTQLTYPSVTASGSRCCHPLGAPTQVWGAGKTPAVSGEDGAILLWRLRDCCAAMELTNDAL